MREIWAREAIFQFQKMDNPNEYYKAKLLSIIPKIRPYTRYEEKGLLTGLQFVLPSAQAESGQGVFTMNMAVQLVVDLLYAGTNRTP